MVAPIFRDADGSNCNDIIKGIVFSMPSCIFLVGFMLFLPPSLFVQHDLACLTELIYGVSL